MLSNYVSYCISDLVKKTLNHKSCKPFSNYFRYINFKPSKLLRLDQKEI